MLENMNGIGVKTLLLGFCLIVFDLRKTYRQEVNMAYSSEGDAFRTSFMFVCEQTHFSSPLKPLGIFQTLQNLRTRKEAMNHFCFVCGENEPGSVVAVAGSSFEKWEIVSVTGHQQKP